MMMQLARLPGDELQGHQLQLQAWRFFLIVQFAWGDMSPQLVQKIASLAVDDMGGASN